MIAHWPRLAGGWRAPYRPAGTSMAALLEELSEPLLDAMLVLARLLWPD